MFQIFILILPAIVLGDDIDVDDLAQNKTPPSDIHGLVDLTFKNDYMTPRGLLVSNSGLTTQVLAILILDIYKNPCGPINGFSATAGVWNDLWSEQHDPNVGSWNELDWFIGFIVSFANDWKFTANYIEFLSPPHHFSTERNAEFTLYYNDASWNLPITFNPYARLWWAISGDSTIVVGKHGKTCYVELGLLPSYIFDAFCIPVTLTMPSWISMGPADFWNGSPEALPNVKGNFGIVSTGLYAKIPLLFVPKRLGDWYISSGVQYYYLINRNLLQAQTYTLDIPLDRAHRNVVVASASIGFTF